MSDFSFMDKMNGEDAFLFKRCIRKLLDSTFIVADKEEKLYSFLSAESNLYDVNTYLAAIGYKVVVAERMNVAMLQQNDEDAETVGLKKINLFRFEPKQIRLLMTLWLLFLERMGYGDAVYVTVGDIIDKCRIYQITMAPAEFKSAYRIFKRFSLIDYSDDITSEDGKVRLYPSLQFCMDIGQLKLVMEEYAADWEGTADEEDMGYPEEGPGEDTEDEYPEEETEEYMRKGTGEYRGIETEGYPGEKTREEQKKGIKEYLREETEEYPDLEYESEDADE